MSYCFVYKGFSGGNHTYEDQLSSPKIIISVSEPEDASKDILDPEFTSKFRALPNGS